MSKLIKKSQLKGLAATARTNRKGTRALIEVACEAVAAIKRPSVDNVYVQGAGAFGRSAVKDADRHRDILEKWQANWDQEHPDARVRRRAAAGEGSGTTAHDGDAGATGKRMAAIEAELGRAREQLELAREAVEAADRRHRMDRAEIEELELRLARARAEPRRRLPKRFAGDGADRGAAGGTLPATDQSPGLSATRWGKPVVTYRLEGKWNG